MVPDWSAMSAEVFYVSYGSNMSAERLGYYLSGGQPPGAMTTYQGARDPSAPRETVAVSLPGRLYFAGESTTWGGGIAFYDHDAEGPTPAVAYRITAAQFADVAAQEMHRIPQQDDPLEQVIINGLTEGRYTAGPGHYETLVEVGRRDGLPMLTFTSPHGLDAVPHTRPRPVYLSRLAEGLRQVHAWSEDQIADYFSTRIGEPQPAR